MIDNTVLVHVDKLGFLEVLQGPSATVLFMDERTMLGRVLVIPPANQLNGIIRRIGSHPMVRDGEDLSENLVKVLQAYRLGLTRVEERRS